MLLPKRERVTTTFVGLSPCRPPVTWTAFASSVARDFTVMLPCT